VDQAERPGVILEMDHPCPPAILIRITEPLPGSLYQSWSVVVLSYAPWVAEGALPDLAQAGADAEGCGQSAILSEANGRTRGQASTALKRNYRYH
jgi:hypothetical protein